MLLPVHSVRHGCPALSVSMQLQLPLSNDQDFIVHVKEEDVQRSNAFYCLNYTFPFRGNSDVHVSQGEQQEIII